MRYLSQTCIYRVASNSFAPLRILDMHGTKFQFQRIKNLNDIFWGNIP